jgi:hypothetical protein
VWGAFIRFSLLTSSFARRSDSPSSSRTSFCLSDTHGPRVPALVERTFPCTYEPDTLIRPPARGDLPARAVVKTSIRRARNKKVYAGLCRTLVSLRSGLLVSTKRVEPPGRGSRSTTIQTGSRSRRDCGPGATLRAPPLLYYGLRARRLWPHGVPAEPAGAFRGTVGASTAKLDDVCAQGR